MFEKYPDILSTRQVAESLSIDRHSVYNMIKNGGLTAYRMGRGYRIPKESLIRLINNSNNRKGE